MPQVRNEGQRMKCRDFEDQMSVTYADADAELYRNAMRQEVWSHLPSTESNRHVAECSDCADNLWKFFEVRGRIDYHAHPCFHVAYYSSPGEDRCLDLAHGWYSINLNPSGMIGIVIGYCPWCGIGASPKASCG